MAAVTLNWMENPANYVMFTDIPNIVKVEDNPYGDYATITFTFADDLASQTTGDSQWNIVIFGETITNVINPVDAINKNFFIASNNISTAASLTRALRNCSAIAANFNVTNNDNVVTVKAKAPGVIFANNPNYIQSNIPRVYCAINSVDGTFNATVAGSKINVDIYNNDEYITTLEKNYYGQEAAFNISPVLSTFANYGETKNFSLKVSYISPDGNYNLLGEIGPNKITYGYICNQGYKYLDARYNTQLAQNVSRGKNRQPDIYNNTILYTYQPQIEYSYYWGRNTGAMTYGVEYLDSAYNVIYSTTSTTRNPYQEDILVDTSAFLEPEWFNKSYYIDILLGSSHIRYNVIKPIKATEQNQRIYWRNSYGGISFTDWTGGMQINNDSTVQTYEKNIYSFYTDEVNEKEIIYDVDVKTTYTLKSHLMEADARWIYYDLMASSNVWTYVNGQKYVIIVESVNVEEVDQNNVYQATVKFRFSRPITL